MRRVIWGHRVHGVCRTLPLRSNRSRSRFPEVYLHYGTFWVGNLSFSVSTQQMVHSSWKRMLVRTFVPWSGGRIETMGRSEEGVDTAHVTLVERERTFLDLSTPIQGEASVFLRSEFISLSLILRWMGGESCLRRAGKGFERWLISSLKSFLTKRMWHHSCQCRWRWCCTDSKKLAIGIKADCDLPRCSRCTSWEVVEVLWT